MTRASLAAWVFLAGVLIALGAYAAVTPCLHYATSYQPLTPPISAHPGEISK